MGAFWASLGALLGGLPCSVRRNKGHKQGHDGDRGLDLLIPEDVEVPAKSGGFMIDLGIKVKAVRAGTNESESWILWPRSSIAKTPLRIANSLGLIDAGYRLDGSTCQASSTIAATLVADSAD